MQGGVIGGICLLAFLLSKGRAEELENPKDTKVLKEVEDKKEGVGLKEFKVPETPSDLKSEINLAVTESNSKDNGERSGSIAYSSARNFGGTSAVSKAVAQSYGDGSSQSRSAAAVGGPQNSPFNPFGLELGPFIPPGSGLSQAEAQAISDTGNTYSQGLNSYPYSSYPYSPGSSLPQLQTDADTGLYQPAPIVTPMINPYNQGSPVPIVTPIINPYSQELSSAPQQTENGLYQTELNQLNFNPYNQGSSSNQAQSLFDSESRKPIIEFNSKQAKPVLRRNPEIDKPSASPISKLFNPDSTSSHQSISVPNPKYSPYERFLLPYQQSSALQTHTDDGTSPYYNLSKSSKYDSYPRPEPDSPSGFLISQSDGHIRDFTRTRPESESYQAIPFPDSNPAPYDSLLVPYKDPNFTKGETDNDEYQPIPLPNFKSQIPIHDISNSAAGISSTRNNVLKLNIDETEAKSKPYQVISIRNPKLATYDPFSVPYNGLYVNHIQIDSEPNQAIQTPVPSPIQQESISRLYSERSDTDSAGSPFLSSIIRTNQAQTQSQNLTRHDQTLSLQDLDRSSNDFTISHNIARSGGYNPGLEDVHLMSGWDPFENDPYPPSTYPQLYPSGADADVKTGASGVVNPYNVGVRTVAMEYPSESPFRPGGYSPFIEAQGHPNFFGSGQSLPIAFEDAKSRVIFPYEYVFPNKMPGGENIIQCTKENEFHHFWSQGVDCLVCICVNEYGILTPVCASCGGCHNPPPKLPESFPRLPDAIPVQPASPEPFEPIPVVPEPYPPPLQPEPIQPPYQLIPTPLPYPVYPEPIAAPSPVPEPLPEPVQTLPPPSPEASCNPLPTGQPFTNPLHPCQICVCRESYVSGKPDVQIDCKENPQCIAPDDVTTIPPLPDVPVPIPLPICEKFPEHVLFPHPTESCKLCKCSKSVSEAGVPEQQITCYPHPDCIPKLEPATEPPTPGPVLPPLPIPVEPYQVKPYPEPGPVPVEPLREPYQPMEPVPLPEIVTVEPLPWPPITTLSPVATPGPTLPVLTPRPGPLPGPSPHESCRPYPPNQTFQHPWDECQICLCTEATAIGMVTVEVNCYTKPSCCIEPPDAVKAALPGNFFKGKPSYGQKLRKASSTPSSTLIADNKTNNGFNMPYPGLGSVGNNADTQALSNTLQSSALMTSTYRPSVYAPRSVNIYPVSSQGAGADALTSPQGYPPSSFTRLQPEDNYVNPSASYPYQPNYHPPPYVNPQYADFSKIGPYKPNNFGYPANYQYAQGEAIGNPYPAPQGHFQPYDPRFQPIAPNVYPPMYQMPPIYPGQVLDNYAQAQASLQSGPNAQNLAQGFAGALVRTKSGNDGPEDSDDSQ